MIKEEPAHHWHPIKELPDGWESLVHSELAGLGRVWKDQKSFLTQHSGLEAFNERLAREFAIETGIIERLYTLDRGVTVLLIEQGIDASLIRSGSTDRDPQRVVALIRDQHDAVQLLFDGVRQDRPLTTGLIKEIHSLLTRHQPTTEAVDTLGRQVEVPLLSGEWKKQPNNPTREDGRVHQYCPPEQVASEIDRLVALSVEYFSQDVPAEVQAAWLHHRFTEIHPFQDGNGRVARCLASLVFLRAGWFPLVLRNEERDRYIRALEAADLGDLNGLVELFVKRQRDAFVGALSLARQVGREAQVSQVIKATREDLLRKQEAIRGEWLQAKEAADSLLQQTEKRLGTIRDQLVTELARVDSTLRFFVDDGRGGDRRHWFHYQVVQTAKQLGYFANLNDFHRWVRLVLKDGTNTAVFISVHTLGREFKGVLAASATLIQRSGDDGEEGVNSAESLRALSDEVFQFNYAEDSTATQQRFSRWLEEILTRGLDLWRRSL